MSARADVLQAVRAFCRDHGLEGEGLVVAVSGGPDSTALLYALAQVQPASSPLLAAHVNHQLRGEESDADERFVHDLVADWGGRFPNLRFEARRFRTEELARAGRKNLEATARRLRYQWLTERAAAHRLGWVATGHTADDQAETVLHRLVRGTGLKGLRGIAAVRPLAPEVQLCRPLLAVGREDVLRFIRENQLPFRRDSSNDDLRFTRNRIRHELLPCLERDYNPAVVSVLGRLGRQAAEVYAYYEQAAGRLLESAEKPRAGSLIVLEAAVLEAAPVPLVREALRLLWQREGWPVDRITFPRWEQLAAVTRGEVPAVDLPGGVRAKRSERVVQIGRHP